MGIYIYTVEENYKRNMTINGGLFDGDDDFGALPDLRLSRVQNATVASQCTYILNIRFDYGWASYPISIRLVYY